MVALFALVAGMLTVQAAPARAETAATGSGGLFVPVQGRAYASANPGGSKMAPNAWRPVQILGVAGIPATGVSAVQVTLTANNHDVPGKLFIDKTGVATPNNTIPSLVYTDTTMTGTTIVPIGSDGRIQIMATAVTDIIVDVQGYYTSGNTAAGGYVPISQTSLNTVPAGAIGAGQTMTFGVGKGSVIPANASAVVLNVIEFAQDTTANGWLNIFPANSGADGRSQFNWPAGDNHVWTTTVNLPASSNGNVTIAMGPRGSVTIAAAVIGYYTATSDSPTAGAFVPSRATVANTRSSSTPLAPSETRVIKIAGVNGVPAVGSGISSVATNIELYPTSAGHEETYPSDGQPGLTQQAFMANEPKTAFSITKLGPDGAVKIRNGSGGPLHIVVNIEGWFISPVEPGISCSYGNGSETAAIPSTITWCTVTGPVAPSAGYQLVTYANYNVESVALSQSSTASKMVAIAPEGRMHTITAQTRTADDDVVAESTYSFRLGGAWNTQEMVPSPAMGEIAPLNTRLAISPRNDVLPENVLVRYTLRAGTPSSEPIIRTEWLTGALEYELSSDVMAVGQTYFWSAEIQGTPVGATMPTTITTPTWSFSTDESVVITVLGELNLPANATVQASDLESLNVPELTLAQAQIEIEGGDISFDPTLPAPSSTPEQLELTPAAAGPYDVLHSWRSKDGKTVLMRREAVRKTIEHNLDKNVTRRVTQSATKILGAGSTTNQNYFLNANNIQCYVWGCVIKQAVSVKALVDYRRAGSPGQTFGVVTTYCDTPGKSRICPNYVKNALNK
ncbi:hypothetical protein [Marisediminicola senii]|uniref:hypothetical protein n=1 Tax=Marisediminicola senii TaxID=2711233 RepID=UPI0013EA56EA|nr:hypothetical protein [Marisediminicola senii]